MMFCVGVIILMEGQGFRFTFYFLKWVLWFLKKNAVMFVSDKNCRI